MEKINLNAIANKYHAELTAQNRERAVEYVENFIIPITYYIFATNTKGCLPP